MVALDKVYFSTSSTKEPFGMIPVMVDGPLTLFESRAIARVISLKFEGQGTPLYGSNPNERALVEQWLEVESQNYNPPFSAIVGEKVFKPMRGVLADEAVVAANVEKFKKVLDVYEAHLSKTEYLGGNFFSLADLSHIPFTHYIIAMAKLGELIAAKPHVKAWWDEISCRPSWTKVLGLAAQK